MNLVNDEYISKNINIYCKSYPVTAISLKQQLCNKIGAD